MNSGSDSTSRAAHSAASRHSASSGSAPRSPHSQAGPSTPTTRTSSKPASLISSASTGGEWKNAVVNHPGVRSALRCVRGLQIGDDDRPEPCVGDHPFPEAAEHRRQPGYRRGDHGSPRTHDPRRLLEHCHSIDAVEQVIERPEQEHVVERRVGMREPRSFTERNPPRHKSRCLRAMERHRIEEGHAPPLQRHPRGVPPRPSADVEHPRRRRQQVLDEQRFGPQTLERPSREPRLLLTGGVVVEHVSVHDEPYEGSAPSG